MRWQWLVMVAMFGVGSEAASLEETPETAGLPTVQNLEQSRPQLSYVSRPRRRKGSYIFVYCASMAVAFVLFAWYKVVKVKARFSVKSEEEEDDEGSAESEGEGSDDGKEEMGERDGDSTTHDTSDNELDPNALEEKDEHDGSTGVSIGSTSEMFARRVKEARGVTKQQAPPREG